VEVKLPWLVRGGFSEQAKVKLEASSSSFVDEHLEEIVGFLLAWVPSLLLVPVLTFFMLRDGASLKKLIMQGVPNAFFEKVLLLLHRIDVQIKNYFRGMLLLTLLDTVTLALGLWILGWIYGVFGLGDAIALGLFCAILSWMPFIGSVLGAILVILICATEAAGQPQMALYAGILFALVRLLDDFVYTPMTVGKSMSVHPFLTIMIIFCGGVFSGVPGLILAMPVLGITIVLGDIFEEVWFDERLRARHQHARLIHKKAAWSGLDPV
jgi:predicted PurR-regulated permease PerM